MDSSLSSLETKPPPLEEDPERFYRSGENSRGFEKDEIRNPKQIQNYNAQMSKINNKLVRPVKKPGV